MHRILAIAFLCLLTASTANAATPLEQSMKKMGVAYKQLATDLKAPTEAGKADYVALAATMKSEAANSRSLVPKKAAALPADQQTAMVTAYQKSIDDLSATIDTLSTDLQAGNWADANKQMAALKQQMIEGHKSFRVKK